MSVFQSRRLALVSAVVTAGIAGCALPGAPFADAELARLIRMMVGLKLVMAAAAVALTWWRLGQPASTRLATAYVTGCAMMVAGPGLMWRSDHLVLGAVLLHGGLVWLLATVWAEEPRSRRALLTRVLRHPGREQHAAAPSRSQVASS